ncbi:MAG: hypothetical protein D4S02_05985 [Rhodocyclaceae bacterium]|nr:MAG: hypothetical protein D4S02_05985 [Rhodocyclaceae bacterium]
MKLREIRESAAALGNQLAAGIPIDQAVGRLAQLHPAHAEFWSHAVISVQSGAPLSASLEQEWPMSLVNAVRAGERSGKVEDVFLRIEETTQLQEELRDTMLKLIYPVSMGIGGVLVFIGFMVFVLPRLSKSLGGNSTSLVFALSNWMADFADRNWMLVLAGIAVGVVSLVSWLRTSEARRVILDWCLGVPVVKDALRDLHFGLWANYVAMLSSAGIAIYDALKMTAPMLPSVLRECVLNFEQDMSLHNRRMSEAADPAKQSPGDPRIAWWPFYIANAFIIAETTGTVDKELRRVAPSLVREGVQKLNYSISFANVVSMAFAGFLIVAPLAAYYSEIFSAIQHAHR